MIRSLMHLNILRRFEVLVPQECSNILEEAACAVSLKMSLDCCLRREARADAKPLF